ncbi:MAG: hypothetical protein KDC35_16820 [Acidobacteria bacterium]|nr:hypothetical protein [Acidobacteriota bacterium]
MRNILWLVLSVCGLSQDPYRALVQLEGSWHGVGPDNLHVAVNYALWSGGHSFVEIRKPTGEPDMVTVFHRDGDQVLLTHYCSAGNQPRMVMTDTSTETDIAFQFLDKTGADGGHMVGLRFQIHNPQHVTQTWVWREEGKDHDVTFELTRQEVPESP